MDYKNKFFELNSLSDKFVHFDKIVNFKNNIKR